MAKPLRFALCFAFFSLYSHASDNVYDIENAEQKPKWEVGLFGGGLQTPNYPGSDENQSRGLIFPYVVYRGPLFQFGDGSIANAKAIDNDNFTLDLSASAALNVNDDDDSNRDGMPEIDYMFGIGPKLTYHWIKLDQDNQRHQLDLSFNTRAIFSTDFKRLDERGFVFEPNLSYRLKKPFQLPITLLSGLTVSWATQKNLAYIYDVAPEFATPDRAQYQADSGYHRSSLLLGFSTQPSQYSRIIFGTRISSLHGAVIEDSSLVKKRFNASFFFGFRWLLWTSSES